MSKVNKELISKFLADQTTSDENRIIFEWFKTDEGSTYLEKLIDKDIEKIVKGEESIFQQEESVYSDPKSDKILSNIRLKTNTNEFKQKRRSYIPTQKYYQPFMKATALILVVIITSIIYVVANGIFNDDEVYVERKYISTSDDKNELNLNDGSTIHMNNDTDIWISSEYMKDSRNVELSGEAYFEVKNIPEKPFILNVNGSEIEVLGTAFNVKSYEEENNVQVSMTEGNVSFTAKKDDQAQAASVNLVEGQYAYLNLYTNEIKVEKFGVENYLAWRNGRLVFDDMPLEKVCVQLDRIYDIECSYEDKAIQDMRLTSEFSSDSVNKTMSVIALSLDISYEYKDENKVIWKKDKMDIDYERTGAME